MEKNNILIGVINILDQYQHFAGILTNPHLHSAKHQFSEFFQNMEAMISDIHTVKKLNIIYIHIARSIKKVVQN